MKSRILVAAIVLFGALVSVAGHRDARSSAVIRTMGGVRYLVPEGWEWMDFDGVGPTLQHVATKALLNGKEQSPNQFNLSPLDITDEALAQGWNRVDRDERRTFGGGATAAWRAGARVEDSRYAFTGVIRVGSRVLSASIVDAATPKFDERLIESAFIAVAESATEVPAGRTIYHPTLGVAADMLSAGVWSASVSTGSITYGCVTGACGKGIDARMFVYPSQVEFPTPVAELSDITNYFKAAAHLKIGPVERQEIPGGEVVWTEQPGSIRPFLGVARRDGRSFFVAFLKSGGKLTRSHEELRADFLAVAKSVRSWDGQ